MSNSPDYSLVEKAKSGSSKAFEGLVESMKEQMYKTAFVQLSNEHDALDAIQETLTKAFKNIKLLNHNQFFKTWLIRILLNECHNIHKTRSKVVPMERVQVAPDQSVWENGFDIVNFTHSISQLDDIYQEIIDLRYNQDLKLDEISQLLEIPLGTVKSRLHSAHKLLRNQHLQEEVLP